MKKIFVGNLSWKTTEEQLKAFFEAVGQVVSAKIVTDKTNGMERSKGFGFIEMISEEAAASAIRELNGKELLGRPLRLSLAQERERNERRDRDHGDSYANSRSNHRSKL